MIRWKIKKEGEHWKYFTEELDILIVKQRFKFKRLITFEERIYINEYGSLDGKI